MRCGGGADGRARRRAPVEPGVHARPRTRDPPRVIRPPRDLLATLLLQATSVASLAVAPSACRSPQQRDCGEEGPKPTKGTKRKADDDARRATEATSASATASASPRAGASAQASAEASEPADVAPAPYVAASSALVSPATPWPPPNPGRTTITKANARRVAERWTTALGGWGKHVAVSGAHDKVAAIASRDLELLDARTGAKLVSHAPPCGDVLALGFGPKSLVVACREQIDELDPTTLDTLATTKLRGERGERAVSAHVAWPGVAVGHKDGVLARYTLGGASPPVEISLGGPPVLAHSIALSRDGRRVVVGFTQGTVWAWDWSRPGAPIKLAQYDGHVRVAFSASGALVIESGPSFGAGVHRLDKGGPTRLRTARTGAAWTNGLAIDDAGALALAGSSSGYLTIVDDEEPEKLGAGYDTVESLSVDEWFSSFAGIDRSGKVRFFAIDPAPAASASSSAAASATPKASR